MSVRLGIIGRGPWGDTYAKTLGGMSVPYWQRGRGRISPDVLDYTDGIIIASSPVSHYDVARNLIFRNMPVLIEKPVCLSAIQANKLLNLANVIETIVFTGHTRLYSTRWREFKERVLGKGVKSVYACAGSVDGKLAPMWDWGPHLVAMCIDLGFDPLQAEIETNREDKPLRFLVNNDDVYHDSPETPPPLECLLTEFIAAIKHGDRDVRGLELGVKVVEAIEEIERQPKVRYGT